MIITSSLTHQLLDSNYETTLIAPADFTDGAAQQPQQSAAGASHTAIHMPRFILVPGLEFDPTRKYRYGMHSLMAGILIFLSFLLVEFRNCNGGPGIDLNRLQALHISLLVFALALYLLSLFGIADFIFQFKIMFLFGVLLIYTFVALMIWMTYEAAVNPCVQSFGTIPVDFSFETNVFTRGDGVGIVVFLLDIFATLFMISAAGNFYKRY